MAGKQESKSTLEPAEQPAPVPVLEDDGTREPEETEEKHAAHSVSRPQSLDVESQRPTLHQVRSHISTHDTAAIDHHAHYEQGDEIYDRFPHHRKVIIVCVLSLCAFLAPMSSTSILSASPEVVAAYNTTGAIFDVSNALYLVFMGLSPLFWGPIGTTFGRRWPLTIAAISFTAFSAGSALAPNLAAFFIFRVLTAFQGTTFLIVSLLPLSQKRGRQTTDYLIV